VKPTQNESHGQRGLRSEALKEALDQALRGRLDDLQRLLARHGNMPSSRPNLELGAAFGAEVASQTRDVTKLLTVLMNTNAEADTADVFLPIAAAYGWVALVQVSPDHQTAWNALHELLADERAPVRMGVQDAFVRMCGHPEQADRLLVQALRWMDEDEQDPQFGVSALITEIFAKKAIIARLADKSLLRGFLSRVLAAIANAPRSASRWDSYRRLEAALPHGIAACLASAGSTSPLAQATLAWLKDECSNARGEPERDLLSAAIVQLRAPSHGQTAGSIAALGAALAAGSKPPRDPTRVRQAQGRGKRSRQIR
jgi:hypothetical protein